MQQAISKSRVKSPKQAFLEQSRVKSRKRAFRTSLSPRKPRSFEIPALKDHSRQHANPSGAATFTFTKRHYLTTPSACHKKAQLRHPQHAQSTAHATKRCHIACSCFQRNLHHTTDGGKSSAVGQNAAVGWSVWCDGGGCAIHECDDGGGFAATSTTASSRTSTTTTGKRAVTTALTDVGSWAVWCGSCGVDVAAVEGGGSCAGRAEEIWSEPGLSA